MTSIRIYFFLFSFIQPWRQGTTHGLGANPPAEPQLPEIQVPFQVELMVRFRYQPNGDGALFHWTDNANTSSIFFSHGKEPYFTQLLLANATHSVSCRTSSYTMSSATESPYSLLFSVDDTNEMRIYQDGTLIKQCTGIELPDVTRENHWLRESPFYEELNANVTQGETAILGIRIQNGLGILDPRTTYDFWNFPGQPFASASVSSFYARFDNVDARDWQRAFDFGNGAIHTIFCGNYLRTTTITCGMKENVEASVSKRIEVANGIVEGEFAFWQYGLETNGTMWIKKNGVLVGTAQHSYTLQNEFRQDLKFGMSNYPNPGYLTGVVLGFRLDRIKSS